jgi:hypothetical protein
MNPAQNWQTRPFLKESPVKCARNGFLDDRWSKIARNVILVDRSPENRQHGNKPYFTGVSLPFSTGNTAATGGAYSGANRTRFRF